MSTSVVGPYTKAAAHPNTKCIIYSISMMALYWYLPKQNVFLLPVIFVFSYVAMAWYDQIYACNRKLYSGSLSIVSTIDTIFKPQKIEVPKEDKDLFVPPEEQERLYLRNVYLFHLIAVVPLLVYVGYRGGKTDPRAYGAVLGIAIMAGMYHSMRLFNPRV